MKVIISAFVGLGMFCGGFLFSANTSNFEAGVIIGFIGLGIMFVLPFVFYMRDSKPQSFTSVGVN